MTIYGGDGSDAITGGDGGNTIYGGTAGGNVIYAGAGDDTIYGGGGAGGGHNAIYGGAGSDTIYAGDGGDAITGGTGNDEIYGGTGNDTLTAGSGDNWIQAGSGDDTITGGPDQDWLIAGSGDDVIQGGSGNEVIEGGSGTDTLIGGGGLDNITGGSGTNFIYGNGQHDVLQGGTGKNYILPAPDAGDNLASIQVENAGTGTPLGSYSNNGEFTSDGTIDAEGNPVQADYDPGYGGVWNFADFDSGVRLGESTVTPVAVYATWATGDPDHELPSGDHWAHDAVYEVRDGSTPLGSIPVDQSLAPGSNDPPEPNDRPWTLLGVWNVPFGHTLTVVLYNGSDSAHPDPGGVVCVSDVMIHPLWPTVSIRAMNVVVNSKAVNADDYRDWVAAFDPIEVPVEGQGNRVEFQLHASIDPLYAQIANLANVSMSNWQAGLNIDPEDSGLELWSSASGGSPLTDADFNQLIASGDYDGPVWVSTATGDDPGLVAGWTQANSLTGQGLATGTRDSSLPFGDAWRYFPCHQSASADLWRSVSTMPHCLRRGGRAAGFHLHEMSHQDTSEVCSRSPSDLARRGQSV